MRKVSRPRERQILLIAALGASALVGVGCAVPTPAASPPPTGSAAPSPEVASPMPAPPSREELVAAASGRLVRVSEEAAGASAAETIDLASGHSEPLWPNETAGERFGVTLDPTGGRAAYWLWTPSPWRGQIVVRGVVPGDQGRPAATLDERVGFAGLALPSGADEILYASISPDPGLPRESADASHEFALRRVSVPTVNAEGVSVAASGITATVGVSPAPGSVVPPTVAPAPMAPATVATSAEQSSPQPLWSTATDALGVDGAAIRLFSWDATRDRAVVGFAPAGGDGSKVTLLIIDTSSGAEVHRLEDVETTGIHPAPDGSRLALGGPDGLAVMDAVDGAVRFLSATGGSVDRVVWSADGLWLAWEEVGPDDNGVIVTSSATGESDFHILGGSGGDHRVLAFDPTDQLLLTVRHLPQGAWEPRVNPASGGPSAVLPWTLPEDALPAAVFWWVE